MDGQENTTSTTGKNSATKRRFFSALNTILPFLLMVTLTSVCYLFIPVGVFIVAGKLTTRIGVVIPAVLSVLGIWYLPTMVSGAIAEAIDILTGKNNRGQVGDLFGMIIGTSLLTILWIFPLWNHVFPAFAAVLQPFHVASMFDNPWLIGLSWLVCIPIPVYATLSAIENQGRNKSTNATKSQQLGLTESESGQQTHGELQKNQSSTDNLDESRRATSNQPPSALTFDWDQHLPRRFAMLVAWMTSNAILCDQFFVRSHTLTLPTSGSTSRHQTVSSCMALLAWGKLISPGRLLANSAIHTSS